MAWTLPPHLMGMTVSGDIGDLTVYTDKKNQKVFFPRSPPKMPPSDLQLAQRERFRLAQSDWASVTPLVKAKWEAIMQRLSLSLTGQNAWLHFALCHDWRILTTLIAQSGIYVDDPTPR